MTNTYETTKRKTNLELLRILCMILIIAHHCVGHGGAAYMNTCTNRIIALFIVPGGKICFNTFLAMSAWFMVDHTFKMERFFKVWAQVFIYSVLFCIIAFLLGNPMTFKDWFSMLFPIAGNSHGFAASYLAFYLLLPFLQKLTKNLTQKQTAWIVLLLLYFEVGTQLVGNFTQYFQPIPSELLLFIMCFFISYYLKKYPTKIQNSTKIMLCVFTMCWLLVCITMILFLIKIPENSFVIYMWNIIKDESSIINIIGGYTLFFIFYNINIPQNDKINRIAKHTFGVLLIHDNNFFRGILWLNLVKTSQWYYNTYFILLVIFYSVGIFVIGTLIDFIREIIFKKYLFNSKFLKKVFSVGDDMINE